MRLIDQIVVHCSFTKPRDPRQHPLIGVKAIRKWHTDPKSKGGRGWSDIGYHYVVKRDGTIQLGRPIERAGAHARGFNKNSIGICLVGGMDKRTGKAVNDYTDKQWSSVQILIDGLLTRFEYNQDTPIEVCGHNNLTNAKTCPNFNVPEWWAEGVNRENS